MDANSDSKADYPAKYRNVRSNALRLGKAQPKVMTAFNGLHVAGMADGSLDHKTKELMALAISIVVQCDDCIAYHVHDAIDAGATRGELEDAIGVAVLMGGGPGMMYATHALVAVDQFFDRSG